MLKTNTGCRFGEDNLHRNEERTSYYELHERPYSGQISNECLAFGWTLKQITEKALKYSKKGITTYIYEFSMNGYVLRYWRADFE